MIDRFTRQLSFFAPAAVMSAWATVMLHTIATGHINRLLSPLFRNYVLIAALLLVILSALYLLLYQTNSDTAPAFAPTGRLRQLGRWLVLLVPVIAASVLSPTALSSPTAHVRGLGSTAGVAAMPTMSATSAKNVALELTADANQAVPVDVTDLITLSRTPAEMNKFEGREVRCVGFVIDQAKGSPKLLRWMMWCCAADAQPISVGLSGTIPGNWKDTQWVEIVGKAHFPSTLGRVLPQIIVESAKATTEPDEPYLSP